MYQVWATVDGEENVVLAEGVGALEAVAAGRASAHRLLEKGHNVDLADPARLWRVSGEKRIPGEWVLLNPVTDGSALSYQGRTHHATVRFDDGRSGRVRELVEDLARRTRSRSLKL